MYLNGVRNRGKMTRKSYKLLLSRGISKFTIMQHITPELYIQKSKIDGHNNKMRKKKVTKVQHWNASEICIEKLIISYC